MRRAFPFVSVLILLLSASWTPAAQESGAPPADLAEFLARYEDSLRTLDQAYEEFSTQALPLRNEWGQPLARRRITDRRRGLEDLRATLRQLHSDPQDMVLTTRLLIQSEALVDDLFDISQIAFDNDNEELGQRLSGLMRTADDYNQTVESYALELAERQQDRLRQLQDENQRLGGKAGRGHD